MKKKAGVLGFFLLISSLYAQGIVQLDTFNLFRKNGDTLYFNEKGYDGAVISKRSYGKWYDHTFFVLKNDRSSIEVLQGRMENLFGFMRSRYLYSHLAWDAYDAGYHFESDELYGFKEISSKKPVLKVPENWSYVAPKDTTWFIPSVKEQQDDTMRLDMELFPGLKEVFDSLAGLLNYDDGQDYNISVMVDKRGKPKASISVNDLCSNYNITRAGDAGLNDMEKYLNSIDWPVLKVHSTPYFYTVSHFYSYYAMTDTWIDQEIQNHFKNSIQVFPDQDSLFAIVDSFNNKTLLYTIGYDYGYPEIEKKIYNGLIDFKNAGRYDINNDKRTDLVIDTMLHTYNNELTDIYYLPNYEKVYRYGYDFFSYLSYQYSLGNHFYYKVSVDDDGGETSILYRVKYGYHERIISYSRSQNSYSRLVSQIKKRQIYYYAFVLNNKKLSFWTQNPEKALTGKTKIFMLLDNFIKHPETLPAFVDSKTKK